MKLLKGLLLFRETRDHQNSEELKEMLKGNTRYPTGRLALVNNLTLAQMASIVADPGFPQELVPVSQWRRVYPARRRGSARCRLHREH